MRLMAQFADAEGRASPPQGRRHELYRRRLTIDAGYWFKELDLRQVSYPPTQ